jgi:hypothetical protein
MAEYINIRGQSIEVVASDPANPTLGQIWYNSTSNTLKGENLGTASWATGGNLSYCKGDMDFQQGQEHKQQLFMFWGSYLVPADTAATEEYNGSSWTTSAGSLNTARILNMQQEAGTSNCSY